MSSFHWNYMIPPPPTEPPEYDLALVALPTLEPKREPAKRTTRGLDIWVRLASVWCRCFGDDHGKRVRKQLERTVERTRSKPRE